VSSDARKCARGRGAGRRSPRSPSTVSALLLAALAAAPGAGCDERERTESRLWTLYDIQRALDENRPIAGGPTLGPGIPASAVITRGADGTDTLTVNPCFAEGKPAAFVTTELWINFSQAPWVQPVYAQLEAGGASPVPLVDRSGAFKNPDGTPKAAPLLIDVGPESHFYSPFWRLDFAVVGPINDIYRYRSTRTMLNAGVPIERGTVRTCPLRPLDREIKGHMNDPTWGTPLPPVPAAEAWLAGKLMGVFDFGPRIVDVVDPAVAGVEGLTEPLPFFQFVVISSAGVPQLKFPRVAGVGPLFSGKAADVDSGPDWAQPHFGGYWHLYGAVLPPSADGFYARGDDGEILHPVAVEAANTAGIDLLEYEGRVALDKTCFDQPDFPVSCYWLDSQARVEGALGAANLIPTEISGTCPFVFYDKKPVRR
jgi:hypothetical protein